MYVYCFTTREFYNSLITLYAKNKFDSELILATEKDINYFKNLKSVKSFVYVSNEGIELYKSIEHLIPKKSSCFITSDFSTDNTKIKEYNLHFDLLMQPEFLDYIVETTNSFFKTKEQNQIQFIDYINNNSNGIIIINSESNIQNWNTNIEKILNVKKENIIGKGINEVGQLILQNNPQLENAEIFRSSFDQIIKTIESTTFESKKSGFEFIWPSKDGDRINYNCSFTQVMSNGRLNTIAIFNDITEKINLKSELEKNKQSFNTAINQLPIGILSVDKKGFITSTNDALMVILESKESCLIGETFYNILNKKNSDSLRRLYQKLESTKKDQEIDLHIETSNNTKKVINISLKLAQQEPLIINGVVRDITIPYNIAKENKLLQKSVNNSHSIIFITDKAGRIEYVNKTFIEKTGYNFSEVVGKNPRFLKADKENNIDYKELWNTILSGKPWDGEFQNKKKNGEKYWEHAQITPIKNDADEITNFIAIKSDITEAKKAQEHINMARKDAFEKEKLQQEFISNISHEIRTPMNGILGFVNLLRSGDLSKDDMELYLNFIEKSSHNLLHTVDMLMEISRHESYNIRVTNSEIKIHSFIERIVSTFNLKSNHLNLPILFISNPLLSDYILKTDSEILEKTINILIENAIKFTSEGYIKIGIEIVKEELIIYVEDTGIGVDLKKQSQIFKRFYTNHDSDKSSGLGLGLNIAKRNIELLQGRISLSSELNKGSTFKLRFKSSSYTNAGSVDKTEKNHIIIAEDELINYKLLEILISKLCKNAYIHHGLNGQEAIDLYEKYPETKLIFMDIKMPIMNGNEATKAIKKINQNVPIVAQTAFTHNDDKIISLQAGADEFISKPINKTEIKLILDKYVNKSCDNADY